MNEQTLLNRIQARLPRQLTRGLVLGIGDDCAIFRPRPAEDLLFTTDMIIEDVHFLANAHSAADVGYRTLARGLSDIAAMGGEPRFCLLSMATAPWTDARWIDRFFYGFFELAKETGTELAGGDLAHSNRVCCDIIVCGAVPKGKSLRRDGARPGDAIFVSGELGGSALGLETRRGAAWKRHLRPVPRLALGRFLREKVRASSAMDLSDGLSLDLQRLCLQSGVAAELGELIPIFRGATIFQALHGGEDYELLFTVRQGRQVPPEFKGVRLSRIGTIKKGKPGQVEHEGKRLEPLGYDHFRKASGTNRPGSNGKRGKPLA